MGMIVCEEENYDFDRQDVEYIFITRTRAGGGGGYSLIWGI